MKLIKPFTAIPRASLLVLRSKDALRLLIWPWLIGSICYLLSTISAIYLYTPLLYGLMHTPQSWWQAILYFFVKIALAILLFVMSSAVSLTLALILSSAFQSAIAEKTLNLLGENLGRENASEEKKFKIRALAQESLRSIGREALKILWLGPLALVCFALGWIPILAPLVVALGAWLLAFQFVDIVLDLYNLPIKKRLGFCLKNSFVLMLFGLSLSLLWAIPLLGLIVTPLAVAAASLLLHELKLLDGLAGE